MLLLNLGTPDAPDARSVRRYLREFLGDPRVIDLPGTEHLYRMVFVFEREAKEVPIRFANEKAAESRFTPTAPSHDIKFHE